MPRISETKRCELISGPGRINAFYGLSHVRLIIGEIGTDNSIKSELERNCL
jgi:hypothetical protein